MNLLNKKVFILLMAMFVCFSFSLIVYADEFDKNSNYKIVNKDSNKVLQIYSDDYKHDDIVSNEYKLYAKAGELTVYQNLNYDGQLFNILPATDGYSISSLLPVDKNLLGVNKSEVLKVNSKTSLFNSVEENNFESWCFKQIDDSYYTIASVKDENLVLTQYGDFQVRFSPYTGNEDQLWQIKEDTGETEEVVELESQKEINAIDQWFDRIEEYVAGAKALDFDGAYGSQCVDLAYDYTYNVFHKGEDRSAYRRSIDGGNGGQIYSRGSEEYYQKIPYSSDITPQKGDLVIFNKGYYGHVAVVESADEGGIDAITINGSRGHYVRRTRYDYYSGYYQACHIRGYLRPRTEMLVK